jgi:phage terminase small subunit
MDKLTSKQEAFAQAVAGGMTQADAYRSSYDVKTATAKSIQELASTLMKNVKVASRVTSLKRELSEKALWTREMSVEALKKITAGSDKGTEVVAAVKELNAMHGYNAPSKVELSGKLHVDLSDEELDAKIAALSGA